MKALHIENLTKVYKTGTRALKGISLDIEQGDFFALLGPNGAGKTTTIGIICSLVDKTSGKVEIFGVDTDHNWPLAKSYIGVVPQEFNFNMFETVENILLYQAGFYGIPRKLAKQAVAQCLKTVGLWDKRTHISRTLSGGMKRRLMIARAIVHQPKLLILDEPTAGVDVELRRGMWEFLKNLNAEGTTIVLTTHYLEDVEQLCRNVAIINHGEIVENTPVKNLIATLPSESFVLDLSAPLSTPPKIPGLHFKLIDATTLEVEVSRNMSLNQLFMHLSQENIYLISMRNKANRLEELFLQLVKKQD